MSKTAIYCQNCRTANIMSETHCRNCGTRLLLVVFPNSLQYDTNQVPSYYEDHLLERVSLLELRLAQLNESFSAALEIVREQGKTIREVNGLIKTLYRSLGIINAGDPEENARETTRLLQKEPAAVSPKFEKILAEHDLPNGEFLARLLNEAVRLLEEGEEKQGFRMLQRASLLSPQNVPLLILIAEHQFRAEKFSDARENLKKACSLAPDDPKILLLLGSIYADEKETEKARRLLSVLAGDSDKGFVANFVWGMTAAFEEKWLESLAAFKQAMSTNETAELQYLIGCVYFQLGRIDPALQHLQKAITLDEGYSDAWFMQSIIYRQLRDEKRAKNAFESAFEFNEPGAQCLEFRRKKKTADPKTALPFRHFSEKNARLLTGGAPRLARFFLRMIGRIID